jgi:pyruvate dehydrogenase E2 component (dihydrolipoamide acetyltransferase)
MSVFNLPDLGEGLPDAEIVAWHVAEGDHVVVDQPLLSVETAKAVVEIPSPQAGRIGRILARPGERMPVGAPLLFFEDGAHKDAGTVVGELEGARPEPPRRQDPAPAGSESRLKRGTARAAPAVRARARELGVDLSQVMPSGPGGSVTMADVDLTASSTARETGALRGARRTMALNMARAWREVVHATLHDEADIDGWPAQEDVTVRLIRAMVAACHAEPRLNATFDATSLSLHDNVRIDLGLAIDHPDGLFVPVLRDVGHSAPADWRRQIAALKQFVKDRSLAPADLRNPTITLSNFGTIAGTHAALIIVPPQVAILGAGRICHRPVHVQGGIDPRGSIAPHRTLPLSLTFDHRAVTGGEAARFLHVVVADLERPA